jgi:hypothetical protein
VTDLSQLNYTQFFMLYILRMSALNRIREINATPRNEMPLGLMTERVRLFATLTPEERASLSRPTTPNRSTPKVRPVLASYTKGGMPVGYGNLARKSRKGNTRKSRKSNARKSRKSKARKTTKRK